MNGNGRPLAGYRLASGFICAPMDKLTATTGAQATAVSWRCPGCGRTFDGLMQECLGCNGRLLEDAARILFRRPSAWA